MIRGAAVSHEDLVLEASDGNSFAAFAASPEEPGDVGVVILPDVRGLYRFYEELALRFAERGIAAVALDYFGRTAGVPSGPEARAEQFPFKDHMAQIDWAKVAEDCGAAVEVKFWRVSPVKVASSFHPPGRDGERADIYASSACRMTAC